MAYFDILLTVAALFALPHGNSEVNVTIQAFRTWGLKSLAANEPKLIAGNANLPLAKAIARRMSLHRGLTIDLVDARVERFNDQEIFVEVFENVRGEDMYIIRPTSNPANDNLMELLIMADALRRSSASRITAVFILWLCTPRPPHQGAHTHHCKTGCEYDCRSRD